METSKQRATQEVDMNFSKEFADDVRAKLPGNPALMAALRAGNARQVEDLIRQEAFLDAEEVARLHRARDDDGLEALYTRGAHAMELLRRLQQNEMGLVRVVMNREKYLRGDNPTPS